MSLLSINSLISIIHSIVKIIILDFRSSICNLLIFTILGRIIVLEGSIILE